MSAVWFDISGVPEETKAAVRRLTERGRLPQSILLTGGDGRRRSAAAKALCAAVACRTAGGRGFPCGKCPDCRKIADGAHPDVAVVKPEDGKKSVSVKLVRERVIETLWEAPNEAENKVYLFTDAQDLSETVQNTLLKSLEEPPAFVLFLFLSERREALLPTVISRCTEFSLGGSEQEKKNKEAAAAEQIALSLATALCGGSDYDIMIATAPMLKNRALMKRTAEALTLLARDALASQSDAPAAAGHEREARSLYARFGPAGLLRLKDAMERVRAAADANANENLLLCSFSAALCALRGE